MNKFSKIMICAFMLISLVFCLNTNIYAMESKEIDHQEKGSITLHLTDTTSKQAIQNGTFALYYIASIDEDSSELKFLYQKDFENNGMSLDNLKVEGLATHLANYATSHQLTGDVQKCKDGIVLWDELELGLYLVVQTEPSDGYYNSAPFLISVPMSEGADVVWIYDIIATPKFKPVPIAPEEKELSVQKVWIDSGEKTPNQIEVQLFRDNELYDTIILDADHHWRYTWENLSDEYQWTVKEKEVPEGYKVSYTSKGMEIIITNTSTKDTPPLIQTGQLNWPIPVLAGLGLLCFTAGWYMTYIKKEKEDEK